MEIINVNKLCKTFKVKEKQSFWKDLIKPKYKIIKAVSNISFSIKEGEIIGFIGPNGAGKTTTIKMLSGILWPSSGDILVNKFIPYEDRIKYVKNIGVVFGQRRTLWPELSVMDNLELIGAMYDLNKKDVLKRINEIKKYIDLDEFLNQPFRKLSLGQQMKSELVSSLIHRPKILFLDEPTIGMDIIAKSDFINLLKKINLHEKCTIILTSHDLQEIEKLCEKIILINKGKLIYNGNISEIKPKEFIVSYYESNIFKTKTINKNKILDFLKTIPIENVSIKEVPLEEVIKEHYK